MAERVRVKQMGSRISNSQMWFKFKQNWNNTEKVDWDDIVKI